MAPVRLRHAPVESHLSNVYRKLGINSRGQLAVLLGAEPAGGSAGRGERLSV